VTIIVLEELMRHVLAKCACAGLFSFLSQAAFAQHEPSLDRFHAAYQQAMRQDNAEGILPFYADEVRVMPEYHGTLFGAVDAQAYFTAFFERFTVQDYQRERLRVFDLGARVMDVGRFKMKLVSGTGTDEIAGKYAEVWSNTNGQLSLLAQTWNFDNYPGNAEEFRFASVPSVRIAFEPHVVVKDALSFELAGLNKLQEDAIKEKDVNVWSQFYADDALLLVNHGREQHGRRAIDEYLREHVAGMPVYEELDIRHDAIDAVGSYVIDYASHIAVWRNRDASGVNTGKNIRLWRREPHGGLKMITQIGTYD
jgi:ketosteroid isomerase-like protein